MKTQVVYVLISGEKDIYTEQMYMSLWSCRFYNEDVTTLVLTDEETFSYLNTYPEIKGLVSEFKVNSFPEGMSKLQRSRILKTIIPELVDGSFLYIDVDTIVTGSLIEIDYLEAEISLVEDRHVKYYSQTGMLKWILEKSCRYYGRIPDLNAKYYNSGALYCKNTSIGKKFFKDWHSNWQEYILNSKDLFDQTALFETSEKYKEFIKPLGHQYNVQVGAYKNPYKEDGKILHFYNSIVGVFYASLHPFFNKEYYKEIKRNRRLTKQVKEDIIRSKELFRYEFYNEGLKFIPTPVIDSLRHFRWKTYYNLIRPFSYFYHRQRLKRIYSIKR